MQTFKNDVDVTLMDVPKNEDQWRDNPTVRIIIDRKNIMHKGDRVYLETVMLESGPKSGDIVDLFLQIEEVISAAPNKVQMLNTDVIAKVIRLQV